MRTPIVRSYIGTHTLCPIRDKEAPLPNLAVDVHQGRAERAGRGWRDLPARERNLARNPDDLRSRMTGGRDAPAGNRRMVRPLRLTAFGARRAASWRQSRAPARDSSPAATFPLGAPPRGGGHPPGRDDPQAWQGQILAPISGGWPGPDDDRITQASRSTADEPQPPAARPGHAPPVACRSGSKPRVSTGDSPNPPWPCLSLKRSVLLVFNAVARGCCHRLTAACGQ